MSDRTGELVKEARKQLGGKDAEFVNREEWDRLGKWLKEQDDLIRDILKNHSGVEVLRAMADELTSLRNRVSLLEDETTLMVTAIDQHNQRLAAIEGD